MHRVTRYIVAHRVDIGIMLALGAVLVFLLLSAVHVVQKQYEPFFLQQGSWTCTRTDIVRGIYKDVRCTRYELRAEPSRSPGLS